MPELIEVDQYRRAAERAIGRCIATVDAPDAWFLKEATTSEELIDVLPGRHVTAVRRIGKLLLLDTSDGGPTLGLRFGMTGRLVVDDMPGVGELVYASRRDRPAWDRFSLRFFDGGMLRVQDPRRLGGVALEPDLSRLGPDALSITPRGLAVALSAGAGPLKARLLDQSRIAGVGNLIADETLWRAGLDPARPAGSLDAAEVHRLHRHLRATIRRLLAQGGSHLGRLQAARARGSRCPRDGAELDRRNIGGRTTYSCPIHQH